MSAPRVIVMARAPRLGQVKMRLAAEIGDEAALAVYRRLLRETVAKLSAAKDFTTALAVTPDDAAAEAALWPEGVALMAQGEGGLGARMLRLLSTATPARPVAVVGSDIPDLGPTPPRAAFAALARAPQAVALGPAHDGGFYMIAAAQPAAADALDGLTWSHDRVLEQVAARFDALGRPARLVGPRLRDVDIAADLPPGWLERRDMPQR